MKIYDGPNLDLYRLWNYIVLSKLKSEILNQLNYKIPSTLSKHFINIFSTIFIFKYMTIYINDSD